jgi:WD40 repeat protein
LTVYDYHFSVWDTNLDVLMPIFNSYIYEGSTILSGCFSPTRPGVIYIGKSDGRIQVWDLADVSHQEVQDITPGS